MRSNEYEKLIAQNEEKIRQKEEKIKELRNEVKDLKAKNEQLNDDMLLHKIKNEVSASDVSDLIMVSKIMKEEGISADELKEMFSKGENK